MYEEKYNLYQKENIGFSIVTTDKDVPLMLGFPLSGVGIGVDTGTRVGFFTGYFTVIDGATFVQVEFLNPIFQNGISYLFGAINSEFVTIREVSTNSKAQSILNQLLENQKTILENNLVCAKIISLVGGTTAQKQKLSDLQARLQIRNAQINNSTFIDNKQTGTPDTQLTQYTPELSAIITNPAIGVVLTTTSILIISGVVILVTSGVTYLIVSGALKESNLDLKYSDELTSELVKLLPKETYEKLMQENAAFSRVANRAVKFASGSSYLKMAGYIAVGVAGFYALDTFAKSTKK